MENNTSAFQTLIERNTKHFEEAGEYGKAIASLCMDGNHAEGTILCLKDLFKLALVDVLAEKGSHIKTVMRMRNKFLKGLISEETYICFLDNLVKNILASIALHGATAYIQVKHLMCGAYMKFFSIRTFEDKKVETTSHQELLKEASQIITTRIPIVFKAFKDKVSCEKNKKDQEKGWEMAEQIERILPNFIFVSTILKYDSTGTPYLEEVTTPIRKIPSLSKH